MMIGPSEKDVARIPEGTSYNGEGPKIDYDGNIINKVEGDGNHNPTKADILANLLAEAQRARNVGTLGAIVSSPSLDQTSNSETNRDYIQ